MSTSGKHTEQRTRFGIGVVFCFHLCIFLPISVLFIVCRCFLLRFARLRLLFAGFRLCLSRGRRRHSSSSRWRGNESDCRWSHQHRARQSASERRRREILCRAGERNSQLWHVCTQKAAANKKLAQTTVRKRASIRRAMLFKYTLTCRELLVLAGLSGDEGAESESA